MPVHEHRLPLSAGGVVRLRAFRPHAAAFSVRFMIAHPPERGGNPPEIPPHPPKRQGGAASRAVSPVARRGVRLPGRLHAAHSSAPGVQRSRTGTCPIRLGGQSFLMCPPGGRLPPRPKPQSLRLQAKKLPASTKENHPRFSAKHGWSCGTSMGIRTPVFAVRGRRLNRLTMEAYAGCRTRIRT